MHKVDTIVKNAKKLKAALSAELKEAFTEALQEVFDQHPRLAKIGWRQYTPSFNDGDPCEFTVAADFESEGGDLFCRGDDGELYEPVTYKWSEEGREVDEDAKAAADKLSHMIYAVSSAGMDILEMAYGNDTRVWVSRKDGGEISVDVEEYYCGY